MVVANVDNPAPAPDRQAAECDGVTRVELTLTESAALLRVRRGHGEHGCAEQDCMTGAAV